MSYVIYQIWDWWVLAHSWKKLIFPSRDFLNFRRSLSTLWTQTLKMQSTIIRCYYIKLFQFSSGKQMFRSSHRMCSVKKGVTFFKKTFFEKSDRYFPVTVAKFWRTPLSQNTSGWLPLYVYMIRIVSYTVWNFDFFLSRSLIDSFLLTTRQLIVNWLFLHLNASLDIPVPDMTNLLYCEHWPDKQKY